MYQFYQLPLTGNAIRRAIRNDYCMAYTSSSAQDRLDAVRVSIASCLFAWQVGTGKNNKTMPKLPEVRMAEKDLMEEVAQESAGSMSTVGMQTHPT